MLECLALLAAAPDDSQAPEGAAVSVIVKITLFNHV